MTDQPARRQPPRPAGQHLQRVPPHSIDAEEALLGAMLLTRQARDASLNTVTSGAYYKPTHGHIHDAIATLTTLGQPVDTLTVAARLEQQGLLDACGGLASLMSLQANCPASSNAASYAQIVEQHHHSRQLLTHAAELVEAVYAGADPSGVIAQTNALLQDRGLTQTSTWDLVNLAAVLAGEGEEAVPTIGLRGDGVPLLYPGKVHALNAEPEAAKTWLALHWCLEEIRAGQHAGYIDFEAGPADIVQRLLELGATPTDLLDRFHYIRPDDPLDTDARLRIAQLADTWPLTIAVVDGVAEALALSGWKENDAADVTTFFNQLPRAIAAKGAATIIIDHVVKDKESQDRYGRGSGAKLAGISGAAYKLTVVKPFARGAHGIAKLAVTKDRHGWIRKHSPAGHTADLHLTSNDDGTVVTIDLRPPATSTTEDGRFRPTGYMERISRELQAADGPITLRELRAVVGGKATVVDAAVACLVDEGYATVRTGARNSKLHLHVRPFRQDQPATDDRYERTRDDADPDF